MYGAASQQLGPDERLNEVQEHMAELRAQWRMANSKRLPDRDGRSAAGRPGVRRFRLAVGGAVVRMGRAVAGNPTPTYRSAADGGR